MKKEEKITNSFADTAKATAHFAPNRLCLHFTFSYHECTHFACPSFMKNEHYLHSLSVHTLFLDQFRFCTFVLYFKLQDCVHICTVQVYTR